MLTETPVASKNPNITEIQHGLGYFSAAKQNMFKIRKNENLDGLKKTMVSFAKNLYKVPAVKELYDRRKEFDLIIVNYRFNEVSLKDKQYHLKEKHETSRLFILPKNNSSGSPLSLQMTYPFVHEVPFITVATTGLDPEHSDVLGNILMPSYVPEIKFIPHSFQMSFWERLENAVQRIIFSVNWKQWSVVPLVQKEVQRNIFCFYASLMLPTPSGNFSS